MTHPSSSQLIQLLLGEPVDEAARQHVDGCSRCAAALTRLRDVEAAIAGGDELAGSPPAHLWPGIADELGLDPREAPVAAADRDTPRASAPFPRPRRRAVAMAVAVGSVAVLAVAAVSVARWAGAPTSLGTAQLVALDPAADPARAEVVSGDEVRRLRVQVEALPDHDGYYAVWLLDDADEPTGMVSLGPLTDKVALPAGLDLEAYPVVDVSREPFDGDPAHSGDSVLRGSLRLR